MLISHLNSILKDGSHVLLIPIWLVCGVTLINISVVWIKSNVANPNTLSVMLARITMMACALHALLARSVNRERPYAKPVVWANSRPRPARPFVPSVRSAKPPAPKVPPSAPPVPQVNPRVPVVKKGAMIARLASTLLPPVQAVVSHVPLVDIQRLLPLVVPPAAPVTSVPLALPSAPLVLRVNSRATTCVPFVMPVVSPVPLVHHRAPGVPPVTLR